MDYIVDYQPSHYKFFVKKCAKILGDCQDIDCWARNLSKNEIVIWIKTVKKFKVNEPDYNIEASTLITLVILLFMLELDVEDDGVSLSNNEIKKLINRFEKCVRQEFGYKEMKINRRNHKHTLLKDVS